MLRAQAKKNGKDPVKNLSPSAPGHRLMSKEPTVDVNFDPHPDANPKSREQNLKRFQINPEANWGPKARSKTSIIPDKPEKQARNQGKHKQFNEKELAAINKKPKCDTEMLVDETWAAWYFSILWVALKFFVYIWILSDAHNVVWSFCVVCVCCVWCCVYGHNQSINGHRWPEGLQEPEIEVGETDLQAIIDQKNYIEEINRIHASNITNLQVVFLLFFSEVDKKTFWGALPLSVCVDFFFNL